MTFYKLIDALEVKGCPICNLLKKTAHRTMEGLLYERVNDAGTRQKIRKSLGFCNRHSWQLKQLGDAFGLSILYNDLLSIIQSKLEEGVEIKHSFVAKVEKNFYGNTRSSCPICKRVADTEKRYLTSFVEYFNDRQVKDKFKSSFGFCLPHLVKIMKLFKDKTAQQELLEIELKKIKTLRQELKEFMRKHDYRFSKEKINQEKDAWIRAIEKLVGKEGI